MGELEKFLMKDVGQIRALQKERFGGSWIYCKSHMCSSEDTSTFRISESYKNVCTVDQLKFELFDDSVGIAIAKKAANASDNKTSVFSAPSILRRKAVAGPSGLFTTVFYTIYSLSEADLMIPSHNCLFHFSLLIFILENIFNKNI